MLTKIYAENPSERELARAAAVLERGGIVVYPTDSVYAFGCSIRSPKAIERMRRIKGKRETTFSAVFADIAEAAAYCRVDNAAFRILKRSLPGPYTFLLPASSRMPDKALERRRIIGIRIPRNAVARALVGALGCPMLTTSVRDDDEERAYATDPGLIAERYGSGRAPVYAAAGGGGGAAPGAGGAELTPPPRGGGHRADHGGGPHAGRAAGAPRRQGRMAVKRRYKRKRYGKDEFVE